jgi:hypothetical protein
MQPCPFATTTVIFLLFCADTFCLLSLREETNLLTCLTPKILTKTMLPYTQTLALKKSSVYCIYVCFSCLMVSSMTEDSANEQ